MKVFVSVDMEGIADLASFEEAGRGNPRLYVRGVEQMSREVAAACRGAQRAGAESILVRDAHDGGLNLLHEYLPEAATLIRGEVRSPLSMIGGIDRDCDAVLFIGYHDAAGQSGSPMAHTISSGRVREVTVNGVVAGEFHLFALGAAWLGVPSALVSGDAAICEKARAFSAPIVTVETKRAVGGALASIHPAVAERRLEEAAEHALSGDLSRYAIPLPPRFQVEVAWHKYMDAERASHYLGAKRTGPHAVAFETADYGEALRFLFFTL